MRLTLLEAVWGRTGWNWPVGLDLLRLILFVGRLEMVICFYFYLSGLLYVFQGGLGRVGRLGPGGFRTYLRGLDYYARLFRGCSWDPQLWRGATLVGLTWLGGSVWSGLGWLWGEGDSWMETGTGGVPIINIREGGHFMVTF